jgi:ribosomal protein S18 acetylase RimI-like enzyme
MADNVNNIDQWIDIHQLLIEDIPGYLQVLPNLAEVKTDLETAKMVYERDIVTNPLHYIFVAIDKRKGSKAQVIACCTLLVEPKFIGNADRVGHIEDVAVATEYQGLGIGSRIVDYVTGFGFEKMKCVKVELDCSESTMPFYKKLGYIYSDILMKKLNKS